MAKYYKDDKVSLEKKILTARTNWKVGASPGVRQQGHHRFKRLMAKYHREHSCYPEEFQDALLERNRYYFKWYDCWVGPYSNLKIMSNHRQSLLKRCKDKEYKEFYHKYL